MYKYLLFDLDGTLTDPKQGITGCVQYALHKMGIEEPDADKLTPFIGPPLLDSFHEFYGFSEKQGWQATEYYRERFRAVGWHENVVYPGMEKLLSNLKDAGKKLAVASSKPQEFVEQILEHFGLRSYFDVIVGSGMDGTRMRKEEVVEEALRCLLPKELFRGIMDGRRTGNGTVSEEKDGERFDTLGYDMIAMVGDRRFDIESAKAYRIASVGVAYGYAAPGELSAAGADVIVETVEELAKALG